MNLWDRRARLFVESWIRKFGKLTQFLYFSDRKCREFVRQYQREHGLVADGLAGVRTFAHILDLHWPVESYHDPAVPDVRHPIVSRGFVPGHDGLDIDFEGLPHDDKSPERYSYEGGRAYAFPEGPMIVAPCDGVITAAKRIRTGYLCYLGDVTGGKWLHFHGSDLRVKVGQHVSRGAELMTPGYDPRWGPNLIHLHWSRVDPFAKSRVDPRPWIEVAKFAPAVVR